MLPRHAQMPGMMSDQQTQQLTATSGAAVDWKFLHMMIIHHQDAVTISHTEPAQNSNPANSPKTSLPPSKPRSTTCRPCSNSCKPARSQVGCGSSR